MSTYLTCVFFVLLYSVLDQEAISVEKSLIPQSLTLYSSSSSIVSVMWHPSVCNGKSEYHAHSEKIHVIAGMMILHSGDLFSVTVSQQ